MYGCLSCSFFHYETPGFVLKKLTKEVLGCPSIMQLLISVWHSVPAPTMKLIIFKIPSTLLSPYATIPADIVVSDTHGAIPMI